MAVWPMKSEHRITVTRKKSGSRGTESEEEEEEERMSLMWLEAVLPLGIIAGFICVMGNAQYYIHKAAHGRPKHVGNDMWDVAMERRDKKLMEQASASHSN